MSGAATITARAMARSQKGVVAIEMTLIIIATIFILPTLLLFGRAFWHYNAMKQATLDAAMYMASVPMAEMANDASVATAQDTARAMVLAAAAGARVSAPPGVVITCSDLPCGGPGAPGIIRVWTVVFVTDEVFDAFTAAWTDQDHKISVVARSAVLYGN